jgi:hypothetical protein
MTIYAMRGWIAGLVLILTSPVWAAECIDGDTLIVDGTDFRLDGIDAPEFNQICLDEKGLPEKPRTRMPMARKESSERPRPASTRSSIAIS